MVPVASAATLSTHFPSLEVGAAACAVTFILWAWGSAGTSRLPFLLLWGPSGLGAAVVYRVDGHGLPVLESLRLALTREPAAMHLIRTGPGGPDLFLYAIVVGAAVAVAATLLLHFLGLVIGAGAALFTRAQPAARPEQWSAGPTAPRPEWRPVFAGPPPPPPAATEPAPDSYRVRLTYVTSVIVLTLRRTTAQTGTLEETRRRARRALAHNLLLGWWGFPVGPVWNGLALWNNHQALRSVKRRAAASAVEPPPAPLRPRSAAGLRAAVAGMTLVLLTVAAGAVVVHQRASAAAPAHPAAWDARLTDLVTFVEKDRGLAFKAPVFVDFVPAAEFKRNEASEVEGLDAEEQRAVEQSIGLLRAIGLLGGDVDLLAKLGQFNAEGVLAFYDPQTERITVRGTELTEDVKSTLAHELTHVLQDQHFGLDRLDRDNSEWLRTVAEGDAERVEAHWVDHLDPAARKAHDRAAAAAGGDADLKGIPDVVMAFMGAPYEFGRGLVELLAAVGGNPSIDRALKSPPVSDEQIFDPFRYLAGDTPKPVAAPALQPGEKLLPGGKADDFGSLTLFLMLAQRTDFRLALRAVDGWGGDSMIAFQRDGRDCVRAAFVGDTPTDTDELGAGLDQWARSMPAGVAAVSRTTGVVQFTSCDPGAGFVLGPSRLGDAVGYPLARTGVGVGVINEARLPAEQARCYAGTVADQFTPDQIASERAMSSRSTQRKLTRAAEACRS